MGTPYFGGSDSGERDPDVYQYHAGGGGGRGGGGPGRGGTFGVHADSPDDEDHFAFYPHGHQNSTTTTPVSQNNATMVSSPIRTLSKVFSDKWPLFVAIVVATAISLCVALVFLKPLWLHMTVSGGAASRRQAERERDSRDRQEREDVEKQKERQQTVLARWYMEFLEPYSTTVKEEDFVDDADARADVDARDASGETKEASVALSDATSGDCGIKLSKSTLNGNDDGGGGDDDDLEAGSLVASSVSSDSEDDCDDNELAAGSGPDNAASEDVSDAVGCPSKLDVGYGDSDDENTVTSFAGGCERFLALPPPRKSATAADVEGEGDADADVGSADDSGCNKTRRLVEGACTICLVAYEAGDEVAWSALHDGGCGTCVGGAASAASSSSFSCPHAFHKECIVTWLSRGKEHCPMCRRQFVPPLPRKDEEFAEP